MSDERTRAPGGSSGGGKGGNGDNDAPTRLGGSASPSSHNDDAPTRAMPGQTGADPRTTGPGQAHIVIVTGEQEERTRIAGSPMGSAGRGAMANPVSGFVAVVHGKGQGSCLWIYYGVNKIGRGSEATVRIDFGDDQISRLHAEIIYDPRGRKFYLMHGGGTNLVYLDEKPILTPTELEPLQQIQIGQTTLRFVPLCGPNFDWQDVTRLD